MNLLAGIATLEDHDLSNQRVFVRTDLDAPLSKDGEVADDFRIRTAVTTLRTLLDTGARLVVGSRFGEIKRGPGRGITGDKAPSIEPAAARLSELLGHEVLLPDACTGDSVKKVVTGLKEGQVCVLENLCREEDTGPGQEAFARHLMSYCDMYVADSARSLALESATTTILPRLLETRLAGPGLMKELISIQRVRSSQELPRVLIWGGSTLSGRIDLLHKLLPSADHLVLVGVPANTMLVATRNASLGRSSVEDAYMAGARSLDEKIRDKLVLPVDHVIAEGPKAEESHICSAGNVPAGSMVLDIGPKTRASIAELIRRANSVLWYGTVGLHKVPEFAGGTRALALQLAESNAFTLVLGDDSVGAARAAAPESLDAIDCVSGGGEATLALLSDNKLPGLEALRGHPKE